MKEKVLYVKTITLRQYASWLFDGDCSIIPARNLFGGVFVKNRELQRIQKVDADCYVLSFVDLSGIVSARGDALVTLGWLSYG